MELSKEHSHAHPLTRVLRRINAGYVVNVYIIQESNTESYLSMAIHYDCKLLKNWRLSFIFLPSNPSFEADIESIEQ